MNPPQPSDLILGRMAAMTMNCRPSERHNMSLMPLTVAWPLHSNAPKQAQSSSMDVVGITANERACESLNYEKNNTDKSDQEK